MRELIIHEFITLDGVIQAPGGQDEDLDGGFKYGGWTIPYWHDDIGAHFGEAFAGADAFLLGRKTWEGHGAAFDPMPAGDPFGDPMKSIQKYVVSTTLKDTSLWRNSTIIRGNVVEEVRKLKGQEGKNILLDGSSVLAHTLIENNLVDENHAARVSTRVRNRQEALSRRHTGESEAGGSHAGPIRRCVHALSVRIIRDIE